MPGSTRGRTRRHYRRMVKRLRRSSWKVNKKPVGKLIHSFVRSMTSVTSLMDVDTFGSLTFELDDLPNYTDFTNLFELFKITGVKVTVIWDKNSATNDTNAGSTAIDQFIPTFYWVVDPDGGTAPTTINTMLERGDTKWRRLDKPISFYVVPKINMEAYAGIASTGYIATNGWIDTEYPSLDYFGVRWAVDGGINGGTGQDPIGKMRFILKYYVKCKGTL